MKVETQILNSYWELLNNLAPEMKLRLIDKLSASLEKSKNKSCDYIENAFGAWVDDRDSVEIIHEIRASRNLNRQIESF